jgi:hypothetical protein
MRNVNSQTFNDILFSKHTKKSNQKNFFDNLEIQAGFYQKWLYLH